MENLDNPDAKSEAQNVPSEDKQDEEEEDEEYDSDDYDYDDSTAYVDETLGREGNQKDDNFPETNIRKFNEVLDSRAYRRRLEQDERNYVFYEDLFDFPEDPEKWREADLQEYWADAPLEMTKPGWDPVWADEDDWEVVKEEVKAGNDPPIAPFYIPYRRPFPPIPDNHYDISNPKSVIEELDRIEEFLKWVSYIFPDGSSYEGTVWDDLAHGKGVYITDEGLVRYEGEWLQNNMEGHGVIEVDIPGREPIPGSKLEAKMRAEGRIIARDYMSPEDKKWLEMDIEDGLVMADGRREIPWDENKLWVRLFGSKPEKGRYRYAGQWKHSRMHGCGVYEVNEQVIFGRFYFGELLEDSTGCDPDAATLHAGIAEVAAAKARMFVNKPDGMVREDRGPFNDPQHPYLYEEDDVWMAPGFINQFYEVPDYWKRYVNDVDQERQMWLNSFYHSPLRIPMPSELSYWWEKDEAPEFVLINKEPEPDPEDPSQLIYTEDPLILHTPTGRIINYVDDEKEGIRLFWQPQLKEGEEVDPSKAEFLPLGYDEFFGRAVARPKKGGKLMQLVESLENALKPSFEKLEKWAEEKKKESEMRKKLIEQELEFVEAQICLEEAIEDFENELKRQQKEEEKKAKMAQSDIVDIPASQVKAEADGEEEVEEDEEEDESPDSFGSAFQAEGNKNLTNDDKKENRRKPGGSPFSASSLSFASTSLASAVTSNLHQSFLYWKKARTWSGPTKQAHGSIQDSPTTQIVNKSSSSACFPRSSACRMGLKAVPEGQRFHKRRHKASQLHLLARVLSAPLSNARMKQISGESCFSPQMEEDLDLVLSLQTPINSLLPLPDVCM